MTRKEQMQDIEEKLKAGVAEYFTSEKYATLLKIMSRFHNYSVNNCILIAAQFPKASYVTGYANWKNSFNRIVKKGERAIRIIAPCPYKKINEETGEEEERLSFRTTSVFDISQTIQIPETEIISFGCSELKGDVPEYDRLLSAILSVSPCPVVYEEIESTTNGYYVPSECRIAIRNGMSQLQTIKTLIHEIAHAMLHNPEAAKEREINRETKEIEAESTAFIISTFLGLDTSEYSFEYIAGWAGKDNLKAVSTALKNIQTTANKLYDSILKSLKDAA